MEIWEYGVELVDEAPLDWLQTLLLCCWRWPRRPPPRLPTLAAPPGVNGLLSAGLNNKCLLFWTTNGLRGGVTSSLLSLKFKTLCLEKTSNWHQNFKINIQTTKPTYLSILWCIIASMAAVASLVFISKPFLGPWLWDRE